MKIKLRIKHKSEESSSRDSILLKEIDESNKWLLKRMKDDSNDDDLVFAGYTLTWIAIAQAVALMSPAIALGINDQQALALLKFQQGTKEKLPLLVLNLPELVLNYLMKMRKSTISEMMLS